MIGIDLFSGAGGMSLGAAQSGIKVITAVEADRWAAATHARNFVKTKVICEDIRKVESQTLLPRGKKEPLILFGGPPCKGFSTSNQKTRTVNNPSNWLFREYIRVVKDLRPDWIVLENVKGLLETGSGVFLSIILEMLGSLGYDLKWSVLNAAEFGVPQRRNRLFIVGSRDAVNKFEFQSYASSDTVTVSDAISDLPSLQPGANTCKMPYKGLPQSAFSCLMRGSLPAATNNLVTKNSETVIARYKHIPQGGNWSNVPEELMGNYRDRHRCHTGIYHRLRPDAPSVVIGNYRKNMLIHPTEDRGLSVREAARLQSFPDWFEFAGSIGYQQEQVGNAVPPLLAKSIFDKILTT